jgi:hypothetical protein
MYCSLEESGHAALGTRIQLEIALAGGSRRLVREDLLM